MASGASVVEDPKGRHLEVYSPTARFFHWITVALIAVQFPIGFYMVYRGKEMAWTDADGNAKVGLWDSLTNLLYSSHKTLGVVILVLIALRLIYRFTAGSPGHEVTLSLPQKIVSTLTHWAMYVLLLAVAAAGTFKPDF